MKIDNADILHTQFIDRDWRYDPRKAVFNEYYLYIVESKILLFNSENELKSYIVGKKIKPYKELKMLSDKNENKRYFRWTILEDNDKIYYFTLDDEYGWLIVTEIIEGDFKFDENGKKILSHEDVIECFDLCLKALFTKEEIF